MPEKDIKDITDNYKLIKKLGEGSFGEVWLAHDIKRDEKVALKYLRLERANRDYLDLFKHEFEILSEIRHKHVALVFDFGYSPKKEQYFFTSEFCPGREFIDAAEGKPLSYVEEMLVQILSALDYVHSAGIIHFDIKSENVLVSEVDGHPHVKILDFGVAAKLKALPEGVMGTPSYMAPEIILEGSKIDHRADLYSLGILLLRTLTTKLPFDVSDTDAVLRWHLKGSLPDEIWEGGKIPHYMRELIEKLLQKKPEDRFSNARVALHFLNIATLKKYQKAEQDLAGAIPREGPLVERNDIIDGLRLCLDQAMAADAKGELPQVNFITGPQGIGKSRIISEIKRVIQIKVLNFFEITCNWEIPIWPKLERWLNIGGVVSEGMSEDWQMRVRVDAVIEKAGKQPFCLLIDDFHKADRTTKAFVSVLVEKIKRIRTEGRNIPIFILFATEEVIDEGVSLKRLSASGIKQYINLVLGDTEQGEKIATLLHQYSGGLPLLVVEGLRFLAPHLYRNEPLENLLPPPQIGLLYKEKIDSLKPSENEFLSILALVFRSATEIELANILQLSARVIAGLADACARNDLLEKSSLGDGHVYRVSSQALSLDIIRSIEPKRARELHKKIAEGLAKIKGTPLNEIAYFTAKSGNVEKAVGYYKEASGEFKKKQQIYQAADSLVRAINISAPNTKIWDDLLKEASQLLLVAGSYREAEGYLQKLTVTESSAVEDLRGNLAFKQRDFEKARRHYQNAINYLPGENRLQRILIINELANVELQAGELKRASELFKNSLQEEALLPEEEKRQVHNNSLGLVLSLQGKTDEALSFYEGQLKKLAPDMIAEEISLISSMGYVLMLASRYEDAIPYLKKVVDLSEKTGAMHSLFSSMGNLISAFIKESRYGEILPLLQKMSAYQERLGTIRDIAYNLLREGSIYLSLGMEEAAGECFKRGRKLSQEMNDKGLAAWCLLMEGYRERVYGDPKIAKALFGLTKNEAAELKDKSLNAWIYYAQADLACEQKDYEECKNQLSMITEIPEDEEFKIRLKLLNAEMIAPSYEGDIDSLFAPIEKTCAENKFHDLLWEVYHSWACSVFNRGNRVQGVELLIKGINVIESIASTLPEEYRDRYLAQRPRKKLFDDFKLISAPTTIKKALKKKEVGSAAEEKTVSEARAPEGTISELKKK